MKIEAVIMQDIRKYLTKNKYYWSNLPAGSPSHRPGDPDMIACIKGRYVAIEGKTITGRQSPRQLEVEKLIINAGGIYAVARSVEDVENIVCSIKEI